MKKFLKALVVSMLIITSIVLLFIERRYKMYKVEKEEVIIENIHKQ